MVNIKVGDNITLLDFHIVEYRHPSYIGQFKAEDDDVIYYPVPIYLSAFGVKFPEIWYALPGGSVGTDHPDYYKFLRVEIFNGNERAIFRTKDNWEVTIKLDESFRYTGKYHLHYLRKSCSVTKFATLLSEAEQKEYIHAWINITAKLGTVTGEVVRMYLKEYTRDMSKTPELSDIIYVDDLYEAMHFYSAYRDQVFVVIHDDGGEMEYTMPANLIKLNQ